jgi:transglutaminase-like putative cysteine protease
MKYLLATALCFASLAVADAKPVDLGRKTGSTPYEAYMAPVKRVLNEVNGRENDMDRVRKLLKIGRSFRYSFTEPYIAASPERTAATRRGDCKAKSLWLIDALNDSSARYVIGKARIDSKISHAWVMWNDGERWWILDPTNMHRPIAANRTSPYEYIPLYSYSKVGAHRHSVPSNVAARMAANSHEPVAGQEAFRASRSKRGSLAQR